MIMAKDSHGNYVEIEDIKQQDSFKGISPINFKSNGDNLKNYCIYGNTVNGESVGDKTTNLFDGEWTQGGVSNTGNLNNENQKRIKTIVSVIPSQTYTIRTNLSIRMIFAYNDTTEESGIVSKLLDIMNGVEFATITIPDNANLIAVALMSSDNSNITPSDVEWTMLNTGSTALPYEPYGYRVPVKVEGENLFNNIWEQGNIRADNGQKEASNIMICSDYFPVEYDKTYSISRTISEGYNNIRGYDASKNYIGSGTTVCSVNNPFVNANTKKGIFKITNSLVAFVRFNHYSNNLNMKYMIVEGDYTNTPMPPYEPYHAPVTTNIYLPEQIKMVGDETEYIDFGEQKQHFADGTSADVTLPTLPTLSGTNTLSVNTNIKPSKVWGGLNDPRDILYVKDKLGNILFSKYYEIEDEPPLTYKAKKAGALKDYRIYGNTVNGESVGDRTGNLLNDADVSDRTVVSELSNYQIYHKNNKLMINGKTKSSQSDSEIAILNGANDEMLRYINSHEGTYSFFPTCPGIVQIRFSIEGEVNKRYATEKYTSTSSRTAERVVFRLQKDYEYDHAEIGIMVNRGATPAEYEPYGYRVPVTVTNGTDTQTTNIYLTEQLKIVGNESEYIDFMEQKQHFADGTSADVTLPALPTFSGTNTLSVETEVQPSDIYLKGKIEKKPKIYYYSQDGQTLLYTESVLKGGNGTYSTTPTKPSTAQYTYTFVGWAAQPNQTAATANILTNVQTNINVYAAFSETVRTYTVYFYNGQTLLQTVNNVLYNGTATYTGATPTSSQTGYIFSGWSPSNTNITADTSCYAQFVDEDMYESISDTWSEIITNVSNGTYSTKYHIGDTKKIDLGTEGEVIMTIVGIDTDDLADNSGKAPITWISKQLLKTDHRMNPSYSSGTEGTGSLGGWEVCEMRSYLTNTIKPLLPSEVRNALKTVKKYSKIYNTSGKAVNNVVSNDDIWIPSVYEVNFTSHETSGVTYSTAFPDDASRIKHKVGGSKTYWWLRSAATVGNFMMLNMNGIRYGANADASLSVALGFCLGAPTYTVTYYSQDGQTVLSTETVEKGHDCTYSTAPTKESDTDFNYTFTGWSTSTNSTTATAGATENIQQNTNLYAAFSKSFKTDTISDSWEEIIANCDNGTYASKYQIGDLKTIDVGTEGPVQMQIVAIDTDDLADNSGKAPITWISKQLLKTDHRMNPPYSPGTERTGSLGGWEKTEMRSYLKETVKPLIPETVRNAIKPVKKYSRIYNVSGSAVNDVLTTDDVWIPSHRELFGPGFGSGFETLGPTYSTAFPDDPDDASRIKRKAGGSAAWWWLRSAQDHRYFMIVYADGSFYSSVADITGGVALGFCT